MARMIDLAKWNPYKISFWEMKGQILEDMMVIYNLDRDGIYSEFHLLRAARWRGYRKCRKCGSWHKWFSSCSSVHKEIMPAMKRCSAFMSRKRKRAGGL